MTSREWLFENVPKWSLFQEEEAKGIPLCYLVVHLGYENQFSFRYGIVGANYTAFLSMHDRVRATHRRYHYLVTHNSTFLIYTCFASAGAEPCNGIVLKSFQLLPCNKYASWMMSISMSTSGPRRSHRLLVNKFSEALQYERIYIFIYIYVLSLEKYEHDRHFINYSWTFQFQVKT